LAHGGSLFRGCPQHWQAGPVWVRHPDGPEGRPAVSGRGILPRPRVPLLGQHHPGNRFPRPEAPERPGLGLRLPYPNAVRRISPLPFLGQAPAGPSFCGGGPPLSTGGIVMTLEEVVRSITHADQKAAAAAKARWDSIAKPLGSLGALESAVIRMAAITGTPNVDISKRAVVVMCADNGVVADGVTQTGQEVTAIVAENMSTGDTSVCAMGRAA